MVDQTVVEVRLEEEEVHQEGTAARQEEVMVEMVVHKEVIRVGQERAIISIKTVL